MTTVSGILAAARFDHVGVPVVQLDAAIAFYRSLGCHVVARRPSRLAGGPPGAELAFLSAGDPIRDPAGDSTRDPTGDPAGDPAGGARPALELLAPAPSATGETAAADGWLGGCHVAFAVSDLAAALAECEAAALHAEAARDAQGRLMAVHLSDPAGTRIELIAPERAG